MNQLNFEVNINTLIEKKIGFEAYFVLYCLYTNDPVLLSSYIVNCKKLPTELYEKLSVDGYVTYTMKDGKIFFELLSLTALGKSLFANRNPKEADSQFDDFRKHYPSSVKVPGRTVPRRLHSDLARCRKLYKALMMETTHEILCKAADLYHYEKQKANSEHFMQDLATWLHQKNYQQYLEDINKTINFTATPPNFTDDI
jgi:hypothetical protein